MVAGAVSAGALLSTTNTLTRAPLPVSVLSPGNFVLVIPAPLCHVKLPGFTCFFRHGYVLVLVVFYHSITSLIKFTFTFFLRPPGLRPHYVYKYRAVKPRYTLPIRNLNTWYIYKAYCLAVSWGGQIKIYIFGHFSPSLLAITLF